MRALVPKNVLDWVNKGRAVLGADPLDDMPKGIRMAVCDCPIARALNIDPNYRCTVGSTDVSFYDMKNEHSASGRYYHSVEMPGYVFEFRRAFDLGKYPEYDE